MTEKEIVELAKEAGRANQTDKDSAMMTEYCRELEIENRRLWLANGLYRSAAESITAALEVLCTTDTSPNGDEDDQAKRLIDKADTIMNDIIPLIDGKEDRSQNSSGRICN